MKSGDVAESVYATDLKSVGQRPCGFESHRPYQSYEIMNSFSRKWNKVLGSLKCAGYYSAVPCRAHTSNAAHAYCSEHRKLLRSREKKKIGA